MYSAKENTQTQNKGKRQDDNTKMRNGQPSRMMVHAKLEMTAPSDFEEREADSMADSIVSGGKISRAVMGDTTQGGIAVPKGMESQLSQMQGGGRAMPEGLRNMMESGFGQDFSAVRLHTDSQAAEMSSSIHARAFTHGNDIYFNQGQFAPETTAGQHLIAHELAHVAQGSGRVARKKTKANPEMEFDELEEKNYASEALVLEECVAKKVFEYDGKNLEYWLYRMNGSAILQLFKNNVDYLNQYFMTLSFESFALFYQRYRNAFIHLQLNEKAKFNQLLMGNNGTGMGVQNYIRCVAAAGYPNDVKPLALDLGRKEIDSCKSVADSKIYSINQQIDIDEKYYVVDSVARFFGGEAFFELKHLVSILEMVKKDLDRVKSSNDIDEMAKYVTYYASVIDNVSKRYASYRNNVIEGAEDAAAGLYLLKTASFATFCVCAGAIIGVGIAGIGGIGLGTGLYIGATTTVGTGVTIGTGAAIGGGVLGSVAGAILDTGGTLVGEHIAGKDISIGETSYRLIDSGGDAIRNDIITEGVSRTASMWIPSLGTAPAGGVIGAGIGMLYDAVNHSGPDVIRPIFEESGEHTGDDVREYNIALYYYSHEDSGIEYSIKEKKYIITDEKTDKEEKNLQKAMVKILNSHN